MRVQGAVRFCYWCLGRRALPREIGLKGFRLGAIGWAVLFCGFFSVILLISQFQTLF